MLALKYPKLTAYKSTRGKVIRLVREMPNHNILQAKTVPP